MDCDDVELAYCRLQCRDCGINLDDWLTVHRSITLVDFQLDA